MDRYFAVLIKYRELVMLSKSNEMGIVHIDFHWSELALKIIVDKIKTDIPITFSF